MNVNATRQVDRLAIGFGVAIVTIIFAFPLYWILISSFKPVTAITSYPPELVPTSVTLNNYLLLLGESQYLTWMKNSIIIAAGNMALSITLATMAGYSLTRFQVPQHRNIARSLIFSYMFPPLMLGLPYFIIFTRTGLMNTRIGVILAHASVTLPFATWIMWQFFQTVPIAWEESAWLMGASRFRTMIEIAFPGALPGIMAAAVFAFSVSWNDFTFAFLLLDAPESQVLTTGIVLFTQQTRIFWGELLSGAAFLIIPPFFLVLFLNKYILAGFSLGGFED